MNYILSIDQGGTKTESLLGNSDGHILGTGRSFGACHAFDGMDRALEAIQESAQQAIDNAGITMDQVTSLSIGMTGADWPEEYPLLENALRNHFQFPNIAVYNDCVIALRGGTADKNAAIICAGTGMNVAVCSQHHPPFVYGYYVAPEDQGGGALGDAAIWSIFKAAKGLQPPTQLTPLFLDFYDLPDTDELMKAYFELTTSIQVKDAVPLVFQAAHQNDETACTLLREWGQRAAHYVTNQYTLWDQLNDSVTVVLSGGVFKNHHPLLIRAIEDALTDHIPQVTIVYAQLEPVVGAYLLALDALDGGVCSEAIAQNVHRSATTHQLIRS